MPMHWKFAELLSRGQQRTGRRIIYEEITAATGISNTVLTGILHQRSTRADLGTISSLLAFFSARLGEELTTNDLLEWRPGGSEGAEERKNGGES